MYVESRHEVGNWVGEQGFGDWTFMVFAGDHVEHPRPSSTSQSPRMRARPAAHWGTSQVPAGLQRCLQVKAVSLFPPSVVHEQLSVQLLVAAGGLHRVQQLPGLDELRVPLSVLGPGHQAADVCPLPLDL